MRAATLTQMQPSGDVRAMLRTHFCTVRGMHTNEYFLVNIWLIQYAISRIKYNMESIARLGVIFGSDCDNYISIG